MISFFRRALSSWIVLGLFALILVSFLITGQFTNGMGGIDNLAGGGAGVAKVGGYSVSTADAMQRVQTQLTAARQQQPDLDMAAFIRQGGAEQTVDQMVNGFAFEAFARENGMRISPRLVDGELASISAFNGPTGKFDRNTFLGILSQRKLTEAQVREDLARDKYTNALILPAAGATRVPAKMVTPFASLLLESRSGMVGAVPTAAIAPGSPPNDAELNLFYTRQVARYTVPETRIVRYALFDRKRFEGRATATEAQIAAAYKANEATYAGSETRAFTQAILPDQKTATAFAGAVRGGTAFAVAAKSAGSEATTLAAQDQDSFASLTSAALAKAGFAAARGAVLDPQKTAFGWSVVRLDTINPKVTKTLADVRTTLAADISKKNLDGAVADFVTKLENAIADGSTFDDLVKSEGLTVVTTPAVTGSGIALSTPGYKPGPELPRILHDAFLAEPDDDAQVVTLAPGQSFAFVDLDKIIPSTARPLAQIKPQVLSDFMADQASKGARKLADAIAAKVNGGMSLTAAIAAAGIRLPGPQPVGAKRMEIAQAQGKVPPALALMFSMAAHKAKVLEAPNKGGWYIVWLDKITAGNAAAAPGLIQATQQQLARVVGEELVQQFASAIKAQVGVKKNDTAIAGMKRSLTGAAPAQ
jgi:peptidyl-prolyl cis-trans isomerase D